MPDTVIDPVVAAYVFFIVQVIGSSTTRAPLSARSKMSAGTFDVVDHELERQAAGVEELHHCVVLEPVDIILADVLGGQRPEEDAPTVRVY